MKHFLTILSIMAFLFLTVYIGSAATGKWTQITTLDSNENGNTWNLIDSYDSLHVVVAGSDFNGIPRVALTEDGGKTWKYVLNMAIAEYMQDSTLKFFKPYALHYDAEKIFVSAYDVNEYQSYLLKSFDNGNSWSFNKAPFYGTAMEFEGPNGFMAQDTFLFFTSDNGVTWQEKSINIPQTNIIAARKFKVNSLSSFIALKIDNQTEKAWLCKTTDMGDTWKVDSIPYLCWYVDFDFEDDNVGWVAGSYSTGTGDLENDVILRTTDGGTNWTKVLDSAMKDTVSYPFGLFAFEAINDKVAIAVGSTMRALYTSDGGANWSLLTNGLKNQGSLFWNVKAINSNTIIACGGGFDSNLLAVFNFDPDVSATESVEEPFRVFPNPAAEYIEFINSSKIEDKVIIYDIFGRGVIEAPSTDGRIDISFLPAGIYYLQVNNRCVKFVKI